MRVIRSDRAKKPRRVETICSVDDGRNHHKSNTSPENQVDDRLVTEGVLLSRRLGLVAGTSALLTLETFGLAPPSAQSKLTLEYDGIPQVAYAFDATLEVVALRNSVPSQWENEFNKFTRKGKVRLSTAATPKDVFGDLKKASVRLNGIGGTGYLPPPGLPGPNGFAPLTPAQMKEMQNSKKQKSKKKDGKTKIAKADLVSLGDEFLAPAIASGLILPLDNSIVTQDWYGRVPFNWRQLVSRNGIDGGLVAPPSPQNSSSKKAGFKSIVASPNSGTATSIYGVPYRWGCTLIAYRTDKVPKQVLDEIENVNGGFDWRDLWRPEFKKKVAIGSGARLLLTAALRSSGFSANDGKGPAASNFVFDRLQQLRTDQLLVQDDLQYAQAVQNGDAWIAVGPSDDILALARKSSLLKVVVPRSGTILFSDIWVVPSTALAKAGGPSPLISQWFEYTTQPARVNLRSGLRGGVATTAFDGQSIYYDLNRLTGPSGGFVDDSVNSDPDSTETSLSTFIGNLLAGGDATSGDLTRGGMPRDDVWRNSEFLEPLTSKALAEYNAIISRWSISSSKRK